MKLSILHISDIHLSESKSSYFKCVSIALIRDLARLSKGGIKPSLVFITGDLVNQGQHHVKESKLVKDLFIDPILEQLQLTADSLFIIPGNHEIDRSSVSKTTESGFDTCLTDAASYKEFYTNSKPSNPDFANLSKKLELYFRFKSDFKNSHCIQSGFYFDSYIIPFGKLNIGVVGLNSAWRCSQFGSDAKRLIIGEPCLIDAIQTISSCEIKICLCHHPFEMLENWDAATVKRKVARQFNMLFNGHVHDSDVVSAQLLLGKVFTSTSGSLKPGDLFSSYSIVEWDISSKILTAYLRKWYSDREEFDQETEKCKDGRVVISDFAITSEHANTLVEVHELRGKIQQEDDHTTVLVPLEGIDEVRMRDVFVEPIISDTSSFEKNTETAKHFQIIKLIETMDNLLFFGREEYGKTTLLKYIRDYILNNDKMFEGKIPLLFSFADLSRRNATSIIGDIRQHLRGYCNDQNIIKYLEAGNFVFLIDDYNDRQDPHRERRKLYLAEFHAKYPKCRFIIASAEYLSQPFQLELVRIKDVFSVEQIHYISSFNTAKIRQLLDKWHNVKDFNVENMLRQVLYYFNHFQIPVTPLAVTLFIGVLFRKKKEKNIRNEAYLIENYLETILEKLNPNEKESEIDFPDKESFLSHIAFEMLKRKKYSWSINEFEEEKVKYYTEWEEDVPHASVFEEFFRKNILCLEDQKIGFKFRFWFNFFIAKAMQKDGDKQKFVLGLPNYLNYSTALSYKAGLVRNDVNLLAEIDKRTQFYFDELFKKNADRQFIDQDVKSAMIEYSDEIVKDIKEKNTTNDVDGRKDSIFLAYQDDDGKIEDETTIDFSNLITLNSNLIRTTTEISSNLKLGFIRNNVNAYIGLMWSILESIKELVKDVDEAALENLFFKGKRNASARHRLKAIVETTQRLVYQAIPISIVFFMVDHLANPKLTRAINKILTEQLSETQRLFYALLLINHDFNAGLKITEELLDESNSAIFDFIIYSYLRGFCYENELSPKSLDKVISVMETVRRRHRKNRVVEPDFVRDTFASDLKNNLLTN